MKPSPLFLIFLLPSSLAMAAPAQTFWERTANRNAAARAVSGPRVPAGNPPKVTTLQSRMRGVGALRARLGAAEGLPLSSMTGPLPLGQRANVVNVSFDASGRVSGVWAFGARGLHSQGADSADRAVRRYIVSNPEIFDLQGSDARSPDDIDWLGQPSVRSFTPHRGKKKVTLVQYQPTYRGLPILDGAVSATFIDEQLVSVTGPVVNPAVNLGVTGAGVSSAVAQESARSALQRRHGFAQDAQPRDMGVLLAGGRLVYRVSVTPAMSVADPGETGAAEPHLVQVDAVTGETLAVDSAVSRAYASGNYRAYVPESSDENPFYGTKRIRAGEVEVEGSTVKPWRMIPWEHNPMVVFSPAATAGVRPYASYTRAEPNHDFTSDAGAEFRTGHVSYWIQRAAATGSDLFDLVASPAAGYEERGIKVIEGAPGANNFFTYNPDTLYCKDVPAPYTSWWCILLQQPGNPGQFQDGTTRMTTLFHEFGHFMDQKLLGANSRTAVSATGPNGVCDVGTAEEGRSVGEGLGDAYSAAMYLLEYPTSNFTDYEATTQFGKPRLSFLMSADLDVHMNNSSLKCYAQPGSSCGYALGNSYYEFAYPFQQAFWEAAKSRNCGGSSCWTMPNEPQEWFGYLALEALVYAMATTPATGTHVQLTANFLSYYYYWVGQDNWANRWWVFNHHRLVGPNYGYSPCHAY